MTHEEESRECEGCLSLFGQKRNESDKVEPIARFAHALAEPEPPERFFAANQPDNAHARIINGMPQTANETTMIRALE